MSIRRKVTGASPSVEMKPINKDPDTHEVEMEHLGCRVRSQGFRADAGNAPFGGYRLTGRS
jgi:hypothetical protein